MRGGSDTNLLLAGALAATGVGAAAGATGLALAGIGGAGALTGASLAVSRRQAGLDRATIEANREEAKLAASEKALSNARGFRKALASQLALANFRGGPGSSIATQFGSESISSFLADQKAIERGAQQIDTAASIATASSALSRSARDLSSVGSFGSTLLGSMNLSGSGNKKG
jgi:hypothetical protein